MKEFSSWKLKRSREQLEMNRNEFSMFIWTKTKRYINPASLYNYEAGRYVPNFNVVCIISAALDKPISFFQRNIR